MRATVFFRDTMNYEEFKLRFPSVVNPPSDGVLTLFLDGGSKMLLNWAEIRSVKIDFESAEEPDPDVPSREIAAAAAGARKRNTGRIE